MSRSLTGKTGMKSKGNRRIGALVLTVLTSWSGWVRAAEAPRLAPGAYETEIRPLLARYCLDCHSTAKAKGDLDLERFPTLAEARREPKVWQGVIEQLNHGEMPPKDKPQPTREEFERLLNRVGAMLDDVALARAGDPGPVVIRRLSNAEYTYTVRDLTGVEGLDPAREFPIDGAAGEGFMNTGQALVMSPTLLTKYLDAARGIAAHAVLLPDGFRFSSSVSRRDWTDEVVGRIRDFYREYTDPRGSTQVQLQGLVWETNEGGRLPLDRYLTATVKEREALRGGPAAVAEVAGRHGLSAKYLGLLMSVLESPEPSPILDPVRQQWRAATPEAVGTLVEPVSRWQKALWKFSSVGHIGKVGGPKAWMEPVDPVTARQEIRVKVAAPTAGARDAVLRLSAGNAGDGSAGDAVVWERPRFVAPGRPDLPLSELRRVSGELAKRRAQVLATVSPCLTAAAEVEARSESGVSLSAAEISAIAERVGAPVEILNAWLNYLGLGSSGPGRIEGHFTNHVSNVGGFDFVRGWGSPETPSVVANSSDREVRIPGRLKARGVAVHPSPTLQAAVGWRSPVAGAVRVEATVMHAHPECGNGVTWTLEVRRGTTRHRLAAGVAQGAKPVVVGPFPDVRVREGDVVALLVGPRDGNHSCDLTAVDLVVGQPSGASARVWDLAADVSQTIEQANPAPDRQGHAGIWHFFGEADSARGDAGVMVPPGSILAKWRATRDAGERKNLAASLGALLGGAEVAGGTSAADGALRTELLALGGALYRGFLGELLAAGPLAVTAGGRNPPLGAAEFGLDPGMFGRRTGGSEIDATSLAVEAPSRLEFRVPLDLVGGAELVVTGTLDRERGREGSVQLRVESVAGEAGVGGLGETLVAGEPVVAMEGSGARRRVESAYASFRSVFPAALAYTKIVPVDEVVTLTLFHREDEPLRRLMLDEAQARRLDRLWEELHFVSQDALTLVDAFAQLMEYATQDADPKVFEPLRRPIHERAVAYRKQLVESEPRQVEEVLNWAGRAYRRPLAEEEKSELRSLYAKLRQQELGHEEAFRLTLARVLVSPAFLYRAETPGPGKEQGPVSDWELATRLSYFLWSSVPDEELRLVAASGRLREPSVLVAQTRRMLRDAKVRRLAIEFGCQWLNIHGFDELDEKSERHFPTFGALREVMYEESIRFFTDFFREDGTVHGLLDGDAVSVNEALARHYGIPGVTGAEWTRVSNAGRYGRGGILGLSATLAKQSGASRTSPILRGNWVSEVLLGEKLPRPPKDVPRLPEDEADTEGQTVRQLVEKHSSDPRCSSCHVRIDPYGFALERYDAIGRFRERDLADRPIATRTKSADGSEFEGMEGLRKYLLEKRGGTFKRQFCRKLLGYALGRAVLISDQPLIDSMLATLASNSERVGAAVEVLVTSRQFREIRGREVTEEP